MGEAKSRPSAGVRRRIRIPDRGCPLEPQRPGAGITNMIMRADDRSTAELVQESVEHVREIFRKEIRLAKAEAKEEAAKAGRGAIAAGAALLFGVFTIHFILWALVWALAPQIDFWVASLVVAGGTLIIAVICGLVARNILNSVSLKPERAVRQLQETAVWVKNQRA
jgi:uncharacterized membrane protein YqjE